ncbi:sodium/solute symporter [Methyloversatilis sp. XJ19-49]|uniref:sodium:solute symporter family transporter n=1 Tax=Methyloversatilis sp. XJ19-49 TaxID=2963429 RepID=UPI00211BE89D|nr:sodium/solute symporter [Methyloversatilis sp. XJ19-49]MCQ9379390.1 sodium/solute symporter [Methyloversatilis sp. XJ19-49]
MLQTPDLVVIAIYLLVTIVLCVWASRAAPDADELFLAGRSLGPLAIGLSLFASNISSTTLIGLPGAAYAHGISVANYEWVAALVLVFSAVFVLPTFIRGRLTTVPELLERRFDARLRRYLSGTSLFLSLALDTAGSLYAGGLILSQMVPGVTLGAACAGLALFAGLYTAAGGLRAVVYTDMLQTVVLLTGAVVMSTIVFGQFDHDWGRLVAAVEPERLSLLRPMDDPVLPWLGTLIGLPVLSFYYWTMNQYVAQRLLGARDLRAAGQGALIAAALKLLPLFLMVMPGVMAAVLLPGLDQPDTVFVELILHYAPVGLAGLMVAGLIAAMMSSVDSALNSASTLLICDFVLPRRPGLSARHQARLGRASTLGFMLLAALWAPQIAHFPGLFAYLQQAFSYVVPPLVAVFALAMTNNRVGASAALRGLLTGHAISAAMLAASVAGWAVPHFTIVAGLLFATTLLAALVWQASAGIGAAPARALPDAGPAPRSLQAGAALIAFAVLIVVWLFR